MGICWGFGEEKKRITEDPEEKERARRVWGWWTAGTPTHDEEAVMSGAPAGYFLGMVRGISRVPALLAAVSKTPARRVSWPRGRSIGSENFKGARKKPAY